MKAYAIVVKGNETSEYGYENLVNSSYAVGNEFKIEPYYAVAPNQVIVRIIQENIKWNYPWDKTERDIATGLIKTPYPTKNRSARISCALSHYELWKKCYNENEIFLIMEHDAVWKQKLSEWVTSDSKYDIIGINDPRGATRKSALYHKMLQERESLIQKPPVLDDTPYIPHGIAGNSAYIMKPSGAKKMLDLVAEYGLWPNDAIMCRQLVRTLGTTKIYYTGVQGLPSTTSS
jgi:GR25 family glycosyltransferase involved in LPS biosynthesis